MALTKRTYVDGETIITAQNLNDIQDEVIAHESNKVPITRTVNSKALSSNITLTSGDIGYSSSTTYSSGTVGKAVSDLNGAITSLENPSTTFGTITKVIEGGTLARTTCYKRGRVVNVSGMIHSIANNDASEKIYFQISEGYRPTAQTYVMGYMLINNEPPVNVLVRIGADGNVMLGYTSAAGVYANQVGFAGSYLV